jgi:PAS domain-containing protein
MGVIDAAPNAVLLADIVKDGATIIYTNPVFEEITGYSMAEAARPTLLSRVCMIRSRHASSCRGPNSTWVRDRLRSRRGRG